MFIPNTTALLHKRQTKRNVFGKIAFDPGFSIPVAIVTLGEVVQQSAIRADSSASHASAEITTLDAKLLVSANIIIVKDDVIEIGGELVQVSGVKRRNNVLGELDHWEITGNLKGEL